MPALVGGFLWHHSYRMILKNIDWFDLHNNKDYVQSGINTEGYSNEGKSESCMKWRTSWNLMRDSSKLTLILMILMSLTKVNCHIKNGLTTLICNEINKSDERSKLRGKGLNETVDFEIKPWDHHNRQGLIQESVRNLEIDVSRTGHFYNQNGNPGKRYNIESYIIPNILNVINNIINKSVLYLCIGYYYLIYKVIILLLNISLIYIKGESSDYIRTHGGKTRKQANAQSNVCDIRNQKRVRPIPGSVGQKLNLLCLSKSYHSSTQHHNIKDESMIKRFNDGVVLTWPNNIELTSIHKEVYEKQVELVNLAEINGYHSDMVFKQQLILMRSLMFRIVAIDKVTRSLGSRTPGIDNYLVKKSDKNELISLVEWLKKVVQKPKGYESSPVKRVWIPKSNGKLRPLGIPTIRDRALQHLVNLVLEPLVEATSDKNSYGFRPNRSTKQAIASLKMNLRTLDQKKLDNKMKPEMYEEGFRELAHQDKVILDADIKGFFDNINHDWLLSNLFLNPTGLMFIEQWLKSGIIDKQVYHIQENGTPQGGVISPTLANFTLNGLEKTINESIYPLTTSKEQRIVIHLKNGSKTRIASGLHYVRYADDFIVLARNKHIMTTYIKPAIEKFLEARGLKLSEEKTKIFRLSDKDVQLDFLGYTIKYREHWRANSRYFWNEKHKVNNEAMAIYPNRSKVISFIHKVKDIFKNSQNLDSYNLISKLNPILRGWSNYYNMGNSVHYRDRVRNNVYHLIWKWAHNKHRRWGKKAIARYYFLSSDKQDPKTKDSKATYETFKNVKWVFRGETTKTSRYNPKGRNKIIYLVDISNISTILAVKFYNIPKKLIELHGYHPNVNKLIEWNIANNIRALGKFGSFKDKLYNNQKGKCSVCSLPITKKDLAKGLIDIHHINPIYKGGARNVISNMELMHLRCHKSIDHWNVGDIKEEQ